MKRPELRLHGLRLQENIVAVRERIAPSALMLVMKDDAYGHGLTWAVENAERAGVDWYGSYDVRGGCEIRRILEGPARIFAWATSTDDEVDLALEQGIDLGVGTREYLERVIARAAATGLRARVHLKIDTGLHRNGLLPEEWRDAGIIMTTYLDLTAEQMSELKAELTAVVDRVVDRYQGQTGPDVRRVTLRTELFDLPADARTEES